MYGEDIGGDPLGFGQNSMVQLTSNHRTFSKKPEHCWENLF